MVIRAVAERDETVFSDTWPQSATNCLGSCSQSQLLWDFSFSQISPQSLQSATFSVDEQVSETAAARIVGLRCRAADAVCRRSLAGDTDQMSALGRALDRLSVLADRLRSDLGRVGRTSSASLDALHRRLGYHAAAALQGGVRRVFQDAFVSEFDRVRRRSLDPLMVLEHEAVANVERTIKQLHFTATSESVARKVHSHVTLYKFLTARKITLLYMYGIVLYRIVIK